MQERYSKPLRDRVHLLDRASVWVCKDLLLNKLLLPGAHSLACKDNSKDLVPHSRVLRLDWLAYKRLNRLANKVSVLRRI